MKFQFGVSFGREGGEWWWSMALHNSGISTRIVAKYHFNRKRHCVNKLLAAASKTFTFQGFIPRQCVITCTTEPRHSDYTNISGGGPIFPISTAKLKKNK